MTAGDKPNYPDILGAMTANRRANLDVIQCALALNPPQSSAGKVFEIVLLAQNMSDIDVDLIVVPELPEQDTTGHRKRFLLKSSRLRVGMRPAEVGFMTLPALTSPTTSPGQYPVSVHVEVKRMGRHPQRIRQGEGGSAYIAQDMPDAAQNHLRALQTLSFSAEMPQRGTLQTGLELMPPALAHLTEVEKKANWISLWTVRDHVDVFVIAEKVWPDVMAVTQKLTREKIFMPLMRATEQHFNACSYPLHPPEAIFITKLLTLMLEMGVVEPTSEQPRPVWPEWFSKLCRLLLHEPALTTQVETLVSRLLYADLIYDAALHGFSMLHTITNENYGDPEEIERYAQDLSAAIEHAQPLDFARVYLPLITAGLIINSRVTMPREQVRETVWLLVKAVESRRAEKTADNAFIFALVDQLTGRALDGM